eukprot:210265-Pelagomonas_calceolata.AAC.15
MRVRVRARMDAKQPLCYGEAKVIQRPTQGSVAPTDKGMLKHSTCFQVAHCFKQLWAWWFAGRWLAPSSGQALAL